MCASSTVTLQQSGAAAAAAPGHPASPLLLPHMQHCVGVLRGGGCVQVQDFGPLAEDIEVVPHSLRQARAGAVMGAHAGWGRLAQGSLVAAREQSVLLCRQPARLWQVQVKQGSSGQVGLQAGGAWQQHGAASASAAAGAAAGAAAAATGLASCCLWRAPTKAGPF